MTALLGAHDMSSVQAFSGATPPAKAAPHPLEAQCAALKAEVEDFRAAAMHEQREHALALEAALEKGRREGLAQAQSREVERVTALERALEHALQLFDQRLTATDRFAAELASVALDRLIQNSGAATQFAAAFITKQVHALRASAIVRIHVSSTDFCDQTALNALELQLREAGARVEIVADTRLHSGMARLDCKLGAAELDLVHQWRSLAILLRDLAGD